MNYAELFTPHHIAVLADWLAEKSEVVLQIELPHSGGSGTFTAVRSLTEVKRGVREINHPEVEILIWKNGSARDDMSWIYANPSEVMYFAVKKNRNSYEAYLGDPERYRRALDDWARYP
jgi:hypothetical protein